MAGPEVKTKKGMPELDPKKMYNGVSTGTSPVLGPNGSEVSQIDGNTATVLMQKGYIEMKVTEYVAPKKSVKKAEDK